MRRREFIGFIGAVALLPLSARAQQSTKVYRIAILHPSHPVAELTEVSRFRYWREFFQELRRLGYVEGQNLVIERSSGEGRVENYHKLARDVATRNLNLIFAITVWMVAPLKEATSTTPIVAMTSDPVDLGLVSSMARPGGNITGVSVDSGLEIWGTTSAFPRGRPNNIEARNSGSATKPGTSRNAGDRRESRHPGRGPSFVDNGSEEEYRRVFAIMSQEGADALFVDGSPEHITKRQLIGELAEKYRLPAIYPFRSFVEAGGLMAYGIDLVEIFRQVARSIDQILKGAQPGDIPFYQPTKFELVINRKAATDIGLVLPEPLLARADEVIE